MDANGSEGGPAESFSFFFRLRFLVGRTRDGGVAPPSEGRKAEGRSVSLGRIGLEFVARAGG